MSQGLTAHERRLRAVETSLRRFYRGDPPTFHLRPGQGGYEVVEFGLWIEATNAMGAITRTRDVIANLLNVPAELVAVRVEGT